ncbi:TonB-dependent receptor [Exilibacterium tricleocarpae]|uniref:TonB-dependent receptor n=1 Tax=Exilibacterium tricleocarpae TaxID=2591008 RepID=A0A545U3P9_9GAMM|nr:TonB-dependent receptor [Exilibacterium tricleocarpae]TQV84098.1 TonB-dependent receptor [Exilibacterium tricleocarpae]
MRTPTATGIIRRFSARASITLVALFAAVCTNGVQASLSEGRHIQLEQLPLIDALIAVGKNSDISVIFPTRLLKGYYAPAVEGHYTTLELLELLLHNTGLEVRPINTHVVAITPAEYDSTAKPGMTIIEEISVIGRSITGSRIRRSDIEGSAPVDIISAPELRLAGSQTLGEFLKYVPAVSGNSTSTAISNGGNGTATVTLRGLPANNTLVLLNGKRVAFSGGLEGDAVDLNSISPAAVDRIEILKDGASAIYGSDAIAGVVNIILKREFDGLFVEQYYGESDRRDLETLTTNLTWGKVSAKGSLLFNATLYDQNGIFSRDRKVSSDADSRARGGSDQRSSAVPLGRFTLPGDQVVTLDTDADNVPLPGTEAADYRPATDEDVFNYLSQTSTISPSERQSFYLAGSYQIGEETTLEGDISYTETSSTITLAATPLFTAFEDVPIAVAADNIYNPFDVEITDARKRLLELEPRRQGNDTKTLRANFAVDGYWGDLHWNTGAYWSKTEATETLTNLVDGNRVQRALGPSAQCLGYDIDGCEPLNIFGPPGAIDEKQLAFIAVDSRSEGNTKLYGLNFNVGTTFAGTAAGPLEFAAGIDLRHESIRFLLQGRSAEDTFIGGGTFDPTIGSRNIREAYTEVQIPLVRRHPGIHSLHMELAARHSIYSDFEKSTTPKLGIRYRPTADILIRAAYSEGFRAPSLNELHRGGSQTQAFLVDPCSNPQNTRVLPGCSQLSDDTRIQYLTVFGGEVNLKPEESSNRTLGIVWTPALNPGLVMSLDYFQIKQKNVVDASGQFILNQNAYNNLFQDRVIRDENGEISRILATFINIGQREIAGFDMSWKYQWYSLDSNFMASFNASHLQKFRDQIDPSAPSSNLAGTFSDEASEGNGSLPKWKLNTGIHWSRQNLEASYTINFVSRLRETIPRTSIQRHIENWMTHDVQFSYSLPIQKGFRFTLGADNLLDKQPPFSAAAFNDNFDARTHDLKGRFWYARFSQSF